MGSRMPNSILWNRILVLSDIIAGRTDNWIATHHPDRALVRNIRQKLLVSNHTLLLTRQEPMRPHQNRSVSLDPRRTAGLGHRPRSERRYGLRSRRFKPLTRHLGMKMNENMSPKCIDHFSSLFELLKSRPSYFGYLFDQGPEFRHGLPILWMFPKMRSRDEKRANDCGNGTMWHILFVSKRHR
jgi:hypothetical protein